MNNMCCLAAFAEGDTGKHHSSSKGYQVSSWELRGDGEGPHPLRS